MDRMHLDHLSFAAGHEGLQGTAERLSNLLGVPFKDGGFHPRFGTRNQILPLSGGHYLEVVEVLDHPAADKAPFGQAVRARTEAGGGWLGWVVAVDDLAPVEQRLGRAAVDGNRRLANGDLLRWQQIGVKGMQSDPQLPFFIRWLSDPSWHPSTGGQGIDLLKLEIAGDRDRVDEWLGGQTDTVLEDVEIDWTAPNGQPGLEAVVFGTPRGPVRI
jgi:hypothetical protein